MKTIKSDLRPPYITDEHLERLDEIQASGECNMFGAGEYLQEEFGLTRTVAREILTYWMKTIGNVKR